MATINISAKTGDSKSVTVVFDFGADDTAMVAKFGLPIVCSFAKAAMKVSVQDVIRGGITAGKSPADIGKEVSAHKFNQKKRGKSKAEKLASQFDNLDSEEKKRLLAQLSR